MMAVWYVEEPTSVATASTLSQSSSAASEGARSLATRTTGPGRRSSEGASGEPRRLSCTRPMTSSRSVLRSRRYSSENWSNSSCSSSDTVRSAHSAFTRSVCTTSTARSRSRGSSSISRWASKM